MADGNTTSLGGVSIEILAGTGTFNKELVQAEQRAKTAGAVMVRQFDSADKAAGRLADTLKRGTSTLATFGVSFGAGILAKSIVDAADAMTLLRGRIANVITAQESQAQVERDLFNAAQQNRAGIAETTQLYLRLRTSIEGLNHEQALAIASTFQKTLVLSGAGAREAAAATLQFSQALALGTLQGQDLKSVLSEDNRFAKALADGLGVSVGQLRELGAAGALSSDLVSKALISQKSEIDKEFTNIPETVGQAIQQFGNGILQYVGQTDQGLGASQRLAQGINLVTKNINEFGDALIALSAGAAAGVGVAGFAAIANNAVSYGAVIKQSLAGIYDAFATGGLTARFQAQENALDRARDATNKYNLALVESQRAQLAYEGVSRTSINYMEQRFVASGTLTQAHKNVASALREMKDAELVAADAGARYDQVQTRLGKTMVGVKTTAATLGSGLLNLFGGPVGLAITAAGIAMAAFAYQTLKAAEAVRNIKSGLELVAGLNIDVSSSAKVAAEDMDALTRATTSQADAVTALAEARRLENRELLQKALIDSQQQLAQTKQLLNQRAIIDDKGTVGTRRDIATTDSPQANYVRGLIDQEALASRTVSILGAGLDAIDKGIVKFGDDAKAAGDELAEAQTDLEKFQKAVENFQNSKLAPGAQRDSFISKGVGAALISLGKTDLKDAIDQFGKVKSMMTPADAAKVEHSLQTISRATSSLSISSGGLKQYADAATVFADAMAKINSVENTFVSFKDKSEAAAGAVLAFAKELRDVPNAIAALDNLQLKGAIAPKDADAVRAHLAKQVDAATKGFGDDRTRANEDYERSIKEIDEAEAALIATGADFDPNRFDVARAIAGQKQRDALRQFTHDFNDLAQVIESTYTPTEKLKEAQADLDYLQAGTSQNPLGDVAIMRKRIDLLEEQARVTGSAAEALAQLQDLQAGAGLTPFESRQRRDAIEDAAAAGRQGKRLSELNSTQIDEEASNLFAHTFADALTEAVRSGNVGEAFRETIAQKGAEGLSQAFLDAGKDIGKFLFRDGGPLSSVGTFFAGNGNSGLDAGKLGTAVGEATAKTTADTAAATASTAAATANSGLAVSATAVAAVMDILTAAASATAAALATISTTQGVDAGISLFGSGLTQAAHGNSARAGVPMIVGEHGKRELFVPDSDGYVYSPSQMQGMGAPDARVAAINVRQGDINIAGDVGTQAQLEAIERRMEEQSRSVPRIVKGTVKDMQARGQV